MAGSVVRSLITRILFKSDETGLKKVETHTRQAKREMRAASRAAWKLRKDLSGVAFGWKSLIAAAVGGRIGKWLTVDYAKGADEIAKFSSALGISAQKYQALTYAARLNGLSVSELNVALPKLAQNLGNAADGSKASALAFKRAGISGSELRKYFNDPIGLMQKLADNFKAGRIEGDKTQVLMNLFGRAGKKMGVLLQQGGDGIREAMEQAEKLGIVIGPKQLKEAENFNDEMLRSKSVFLGLRNQIAARLLPTITKNLKAFQMWARRGDNLKRTIRAVILVSKALLVVLGLMAVVKTGQTLTALASAAKLAAKWFTIMWKAQLLAYAKFILLGAVIAFIVLAIQDLYVWSKGGDSVLGPLLERFNLADKARAFVDGLRKAWVALWPVLVRVAKAWWAYAKFMYSFYAGLWRLLGPSIKRLGQAMIDTFEEVWPVVVQAAGMIKAALINLAKSAARTWREDLQPAVNDMAVAVGAFWKVAGPILKKVVQGSIRWSATLMNIAAVVLPYIGKVVATVFKGVAAIIKISIDQLSRFIAGVGKVVSGIRKAISYMTKLLGLQGKTELSSVIAKAGVGQRSPNAPGNVNATTSVGTVSVTVQGNANMTPAEMQAAVRAATKGALQDQIADTMAGLRSLVSA